jgi:hypothetical protein
MNETAQKGPIKINLRNQNIEVTPGNCSAQPGEKISVNIEPPQQQDSVRAVAKASNPDNPRPDNWLNRSNSESESMMTITVPDHAHFDPHWSGARKDTCECAYSVEAPGKAPLDPMITVRKS